MPTAIKDLPKPPQAGDPVNSDVLIYDGHCRICTAQVKRLAKWDRRGQLRFLSLHDPEVYQRYPELTHDFLMTNMVLVDQQGKRHAGVDALRYLSRRMPRLWPLMPLLHIPFSMPIWKWCYRTFAKYRYRIGGKTSACDGDTCAVHFK